MSRKLTKEERAEQLRLEKLGKEHMGKVASLGCWICGMRANVHHIRTGYGMGQKAPDFETIPLCHNHHQGREGIHTIGTKVWQKKHGYEREILALVLQEIERRYGPMEGIYDR